MPLEKHYQGKGKKVMKAMMNTYGEKKGKQVFYATEQKMKRGQKISGR